MKSFNAGRHVVTHRNILLRNIIVWLFVIVVFLGSLGMFSQAAYGQDIQTALQVPAQGDVSRLPGHSIFSLKLNQPPPLIPVQDFFAIPESLSFSVSPNGEHLRFRAPVNGVLNVFEQHIGTGVTRQRTFEDRHVSPIFKHDTILFHQDGFGDEMTNIFRVNADGTSTNLTPFPNVTAMIVDLLHHGESTRNEVLITMNRDDPAKFNLYRLNIVTGEITFELEIGLLFGGVVFDNDDVMRYIMEIDSDMNIILYHRYTDDCEFEEIGSFRVNYDVLIPILFGADNSYVYALSNMGRNTTALKRLHPSTLQVLEVIYGRDDFDIYTVQGSAVLIGINYPWTIGGLIYPAEYREIIFFEDELEALFAQISTHFPDDVVVNISSISANLNVMVVVAWSDVNPGQFYLFNRRRNTMTSLSDTRIAPESYFAPMHSVAYTARDGQSIQGYLTLPVGVPPQNLPVVVHPHGGPEVRDVWGWDNMVQFLANRGYAVFQPNFRASDGFGRDFMSASFRNWGIAIEDVTDGVNWLIEQGIADPDRIAIFGASFGGYQALAGAAFEPGLYAAVVSYVGVSNLFTFIETAPVHWGDHLHWRVGHPVDDYDELAAISPIFHVDQITAPVFLVHGANDIRTPLGESVQIAQALTTRNMPPDMLVFWDEGHGFAIQANNIAFMAKLELFLAEHIGGRSGSTSADIARLLDGLNYSTELDEIVYILSSESEYAIQSGQMRAHW